MWGNTITGTLWGLCNKISALVVGEMWGLRFLNALFSERRLGTIDGKMAEEKKNRRYVFCRTIYICH